MVNPNHPKRKSNRKRRRKERLSGNVVPPTEFWISEEGEHIRVHNNNSDCSYVDASLSPVVRDIPISNVLAEANNVLEGNTSDMMMANHLPQQHSTPNGAVPPNTGTQTPPLDDRLIEAIASRVEQKMMVQFNALSDHLTNTES